MRRVLNFCNGAARTMEEIVTVMVDLTPSQVRESVSDDLDDEEVGATSRTVVVRWMSFLFDAAANGHLDRDFCDPRDPWFDTYGPPARRTK